MLRHVSRKAYKALEIAHAVFALVAVALSATLKAKPEKVAEIAPLLAPVFAGVQSTLWLTLPIATVGTALLAFLKKKVGPPWFWETVHSYLDTFRDQVFAAFEQDPEHYHRVTLFKRRWWCFTARKWPWDGWVVAVERSGHTTQSSSVVFRASDDPERNEGVAGVCWGSRRPIPVSDLPSLGSGATAADRGDYARRTFVDAAWLEKERPLSRSLLAIPVEVKNELWGVLVLDSRNPQACEQVGPEQYRPFAKLLGKFLERA